jgi:hypothetical protein
MLEKRPVVGGKVSQVSRRALRESREPVLDSSEGVCFLLRQSNGDGPGVIAGEDARVLNCPARVAPADNPRGQKDSVGDLEDGSRDSIVRRLVDEPGFPVMSPGALAARREEDKCFRKWCRDANRPDDMDGPREVIGHLDYFPTSARRPVRYGVK